MRTRPSRPTPRPASRAAERGRFATTLTSVAYTTAEAQRELLDILAGATDEIGFALAALGEAYEQLDEQAADRLEERLFRPVQLAYGRAQRTHAEFAERQGLTGRPFAPSAAPAPSHGAKGSIDRALSAVGEADHVLASLQDSMLPVEVGDRDLREGLQEVRELIGDLPGRARELVRTLGR